MYNIWLYFEVWCSLKSFSWNVDVKPSKSRKPMSRTKPYMLEAESDEFGALISPVRRNSVTPPVTRAA